MKTLADIRSTFLCYFERQGHTMVDSSPLVPRNDPTLMFTAAGMVQFKNVFTGLENRPYKRATSAQKCVRAGGKHNDLENVGYTARHHTFFEMLGNFSFGDYFKEEAINFAWELVTKEFGLDKNRLLVTVYHEDEQAAQLWKKIAGFGDDKIIRIKTDDNFWRMGDVGPCGPCTEIFIDQGDKLQGGPPGSPDEDGDRFLEFWNIVFMQFEEMADGRRVPLPKPSVDTGMGLERMAAIMQGELSNYDIDLFRKLIGATAEILRVAPEGAHRASYRVIADHLRACCFLMADGVLPSNEGRGYVLRRIMRRAMRHAHLLGAKEPMLYRLVNELVQQMGGAYPELGRAQALMTETIKLEETRFRQLLERGLKLLDEESKTLSTAKPLSGDVAFKLYDTYGFPLDLTQDVLRGRGLTVDASSFETAMAKQKAAAREAWAGSGETGTAKLWFELKDTHGATEFLGYSTESAEGIIRALVKDGATVKAAQQGDVVQIITNQTPFYGESGGQVGDTGTFTTAKGAAVKITDTHKELGDFIVHYGVVEQGSLALDEGVTMLVDHARRNILRANHSATHLLHEALRRKLGTHVMQKGSLVTEEKLRFDVSQPTPITAQDLLEVEAAVNARICLNSDVTTRLMTPDEAVKEGAMALFGEKYGDEVRVVSMGGKEEDGRAAFSVELCGGTHVKRTGDIGAFKIIAESAVAAGVRRIEALTGQRAIAYLSEQEQRLQHIAATLKVSPAETVERVAALADDRKKLEREVGELRRQLALAGGGGTGAAAVEAPKQIGSIALLARVLHDLPAKDLKPMADQLRQQMASGVIVLLSGFEGKVSLVVSVSSDLTAKVSAVDLVRVGAEAVGGKGGGGRPDMAQAGGSDVTAMPQAVTAIEQMLAARAQAA